MCKDKLEYENLIWKPTKSVVFDIHSINFDLNGDIKFLTEANTVVAVQCCYIVLL